MALECKTCGSTFRGNKALQDCVGSHGVIQVPSRPKAEAK
jgi:hypothetical protein